MQAGIVVPVVGKWAGLAWYEIFTLAVGALTVVVFGVYVGFWRHWIVRHDIKRVAVQKGEKKEGDK